MSAFDWFQLLGLGMLAGALGQSIRTIVGLKKTSDTAAAGTSMSDNIDVSRLVISILIGAVAGALAAITTLYGKLGVISTEMFLGLMGAGYAGSDFIEGFMTKFIPGASSGGGSGGNPPAANQVQTTDGAVG